VGLQTQERQVKVTAGETNQINLALSGSFNLHQHNKNKIGEIRIFPRFPYSIYDEPDASRLKDV
jgi:hypothetical protein